MPAQDDIQTGAMNEGWAQDNAHVGDTRARPSPWIGATFGLLC